MKVRVEYCDGRYWIEDYKGWDETGLAGVEISDDDWDRYQEYVALSREWQHKLAHLDNIQYAKDNPNDELAQQYAKDAEHELETGSHRRS
jgi:hypothetical protein